MPTLQTRQLEILTGGGSIGHCTKTACTTLHSHGLNYPNGLIVHPTTKQIYVPSSITGKIHVFTLHTNPTARLQKVHTIRLPQPIDNLSVDAKGDVYAATFPRTWEFIEHQKRPWEVRPPAAVWRVRQMGEEMRFETEKVLEGSGAFLPSATVAIHDTKAKRMFLGGMYCGLRVWGGS